MPISKFHLPIVVFIVVMVVLIVAILFPRHAHSPGDASHSPENKIVPAATSTVLTTTHPSSGERIFFTDSKTWQKIREGITVPENCFLKRQEYCIRDAQFVDGVIQKYLSRYSEYDNKTFSDSDVAELIKNLGVNYETAWQTPDGLYRLEQALDQRYKQPKIVDKGLSVGVNVGVVPGKLSLSLRHGVVIGASEHYDGSALQWKSTEWMILLRDYHQRYPQARYIHLVADLPGVYYEPNRFEFIYDQTEDRILLFHPGYFSGIYRSDKLHGDFDSYIQGHKKMELYSDLKRERTALKYEKFDFEEKIK